MGSHFFLGVVAGVPGTGKTSVARVLARELGCHAYDVSERAVSMGLATPDPTGRATRVLADGAERVLASDMLECAKREGCCIVDTHYPSLVLDVADEHVAFIVVLRCNPLELLERLSRRGWPRGKVLENAVAEAFSVIYDDLGWHSAEAIEVDTTGRSAEESAREALSALEEWRVGARINWLEDEDVASVIPRLLAELDSQNYGLRL